MFRFEELEIWRLAIEYAEDIYQLTEAQIFPINERYNLIDQLKRAAVSISSNIAEGSGVSTDKNFCSYLDIAVASALETVSLMSFAEKRGYIACGKKAELYSKAETLIKKIRSFKKSIKVS